MDGISDADRREEEDVDDSQSTWHSPSESLLYRYLALMCVFVLMLVLMVVAVVFVAVEQVDTGVSSIVFSGWGRRVPLVGGEE